MSCEISESGKKQYHKEQIEKIKKFRCDLEKIKLEFGETLYELRYRNACTSN